MDPAQYQQLLNRISKIESQVAETNKLVRKMHSATVVARIFKFVYLAIIIGLGIGLYYFLQPFYDTLGSIYNFGSNNTTQESGVIQNLDPNQLSELFEITGR